MKALITGDRGFLGRHFSAELKRRGFEVTGLDTKASSAQDCRDYFRTQGRNLGNPHRPHFDLVVHCAAVVGGRATIERDPLATAESLSIDAEMFRWAARARPGRVIYFSSSAAYPVEYQRAGYHRILTEDTVDVTAAGPKYPLLLPDEIYGWSKVTGELLADRLRTVGVPVTVVRPFSGYGEDQDLDYPFPAIMDRVRRLQPGQPLELWCGDCTRDWVHVDDLVAATLAVADSGTDQPVNICTGRPTSFVGLAAIALHTAGKATGTEIRPNPDAPQGVVYRVGDPTRMIEYYTPLVSLEQGVVRALNSPCE